MIEVLEKSWNFQSSIGNTVSYFKDTHLLLITYCSFTATFVSHLPLLSYSHVLEKLNRSFDSNVPVFRGQVDAILNFTECLTLGITLVQSKPAKVET